LVALLDPRDRHHDRALALVDALEREQAQRVTTDAILCEFGNFFARSPLRSRAAEWIRAVGVDEEWEVVPLERSLLLKAEARYLRHSDKNWSLVDCHTMELMRERGIRRIATSDAGFRQAGFRCEMLPKEA